MICPKLIEILHLKSIVLTVQSAFKSMIIVIAKTTILVMSSSKILFDFILQKSYTGIKNLRVPHF